LNKKCATVHKTYYNRSLVHECKQGFLASNKNFSTYIPFLPSDVTKELVKTILAMKLWSWCHNSPLLPPNMLSHTCLIITSSKERSNNMHPFIHQEHNKGSHLINHPIKLRIHHKGITQYGHNHDMQVIWHLNIIAQERDRSSYCHKPIVQMWTTPSIKHITMDHLSMNISKDS
jgi:hypothetical protein